MISAIGTTVPNALETCVTATILVRGPIRAFSASRSRIPSSEIGATLIAALFDFFDQRGGDLEAYQFTFGLLGLLLAGFALVFAWLIRPAPETTP